MKMAIRFLLFVTLICAIKGFPEVLKKEETPQEVKIKATPAFLSKKLEDLQTEERFVSCPNPLFHCTYHHPVCVWCPTTGGNCCPTDRPIFHNGFCHAIHY